VIRKSEITSPALFEPNLSLKIRNIIPATVTLTIKGKIMSFSGISPTLNDKISKIGITDNIIKLNLKK
jgi:hypothetical protein